MKQFISTIFVLLLLSTVSILFAAETVIKLDAPDVAEQWKFTEKTGSIQNGELVFDGTTNMPKGFFLPLEWNDAKLSAKFMVEPGPDDKVLACGFIVRAVDANHYYYVHFDRRSAILVRADESNDWTEITRVAVPNRQSGKWYDASLEVNDDTLTVSFDGKKLYEAKDTSLKGAGRIGFYSRQGIAHVKDIRVDGNAQAATAEWNIPTPVEYTVKKIWDIAPHSAFTDITFFHGEFYCTFREGTGHVPGQKTGDGDGEIRVIKSKDGETWHSVVLLKKKGYDLRDSKISETPDGRLMLTIGGSIYIDGRLTARQPHVSFSDKNGENFSEPQPIVIDPAIRSDMDWVWRVTWYNGIGYAVVYQDWQAKNQPWVSGLLKTTDGVHYDLVKKFEVDGMPNEATVRFDDAGKMFILLRREGGSSAGGMGTSSAPYTDWTWQETGKRLGGPDFLFLPNGKILIGSRAYDNGIATALYRLNPQGQMIEIVRLPSNGDTSYPGFVIHDEILWVSYYSGHEGKTSIYLAKIPLKEIEKAVEE